MLGGCVGTGALLYSVPDDLDGVHGMTYRTLASSMTLSIILAACQSIVPAQTQTMGAGPVDVTLEHCPYRVSFPQEPSAPMPIEDDIGSTVELDWQGDVYSASCICGTAEEPIYPERITEREAERYWARAIFREFPDVVVLKSEFEESDALGKVLNLRVARKETVFGDRVVTMRMVFGESCIFAAAVNRAEKRVEGAEQRFLDSIFRTSDLQALGAEP
jgi:hypothetical protein